MFFQCICCSFCISRKIFQQINWKCSLAMCTTVILKIITCFWPYFVDWVNFQWPIIYWRYHFACLTFAVSSDHKLFFNNKEFQIYGIACFSFVCVEFSAWNRVHMICGSRTWPRAASIFWTVPTHTWKSWKRRQILNWNVSAVQYLCTCADVCVCVCVFSQYVQQMSIFKVLKLTFWFWIWVFKYEFESSNLNFWFWIWIVCGHQVGVQQCLVYYDFSY